MWSPVLFVAIFAAGGMWSALRTLDCPQGAALAIGLLTGVAVTVLLSGLLYRPFSF